METLFSGLFIFTVIAGAFAVLALIAEVIQWLCD